MLLLYHPARSLLKLFIWLNIKNNERLNSVTCYAYYLGTDHTGEQGSCTDACLAQISWFINKQTGPRRLPLAQGHSTNEKQRGLCTMPHCTKDS
jgi:hypothetical protein